MKRIFVLSILLFFCLTNELEAQNKFRVTLDAGHGDHDPGAISNGHVEKKLNLEMVLKIGKILEQHPDVQVIYTRKSDVFVELVERANIANKAKSDIFVSIHCNYNDREGAYGTQTFVMGLSKNNSNLEVSKRENAVVTLEKDYKKKYKGFDPKKPETLIGVTLMQEEYLQNSIDLAGKIENNFKNMLGLKSRGVGQEPFAVLHRAYMPRVLVETGFISNKNEGDRIESESGQNDVAEAVAKAILSYKDDNFDPNEVRDSYTPTYNDEPKVEPKSQNTNSNSTSTSNNTKAGVFYKVQLCASPKKTELKSYNFKGLDDLSFEKEGKVYKYFHGNESSYNAIEILWNQAKKKGYKSSFIVAYKDGKNIPVKEARKLQ